MSETEKKKLDEISIKLMRLLSIADTESSLEVQRLQEEGNTLIDNIVKRNNDDSYNTCVYCDRVLDIKNTMFNHLGLYELITHCNLYHKPCVNCNTKFSHINRNKDSILYRLEYVSSLLEERSEAEVTEDLISLYIAISKDSGVIQILPLDQVWSRYKGSKFKALSIDTSEIEALCFLLEKDEITQQNNQPCNSLDRTRYMSKSYRELTKLVEGWYNLFLSKEPIKNRTYQQPVVTNDGVLLSSILINKQKLLEVLEIVLSLLGTPIKIFDKIKEELR